MFYFLLDSQHLFFHVYDLKLHQGTFFPRRVTSPLLKIEFPHLRHLYLGHHLASLLVFVRVDFRHEFPPYTHAFMVPHWGLYCVVAPSSRPCLEHPSWVIIAFMESIPSPFVPHYSPPSFIAWSLSYVAQYGLQSHCPLSLMILWQLLPCHSCPLCSNKGSRPFATPSFPFSPSSLVSVCLSLYCSSLVP